MNAHFHAQDERPLAPPPPSPSASDARPSSLSSRMLQRVCQAGGSNRACLLSIRNGEFIFEDGFEMARQVFQNVMSQLFWGSAKHQLHQVVLGLKKKLCLIIELPGQRQHRKFILALFEADIQITPYMIGRMEGIAQTWLEIGSAQLTPTPRLIEACSVCDRLETKQGWTRWDEFLGNMLKISVSHKLCQDCADDLYDEAMTSSASVHSHPAHY